MTFFKQLGAVTRSSLSTIPNRAGASLVVVIGMACAVGAMLSVMSLSAGMTQIMSKGRSDRAIVFAQGTQGGGGSHLSRANVGLIMDASPIRKSASGRPLASAEVATGFVVTRQTNGLSTQIEARGVGPQGLAMRPEVHLIGGRMFRPGKFEVIVGKNAGVLYRNMNIGDRIDLPQGAWRIVGVFESGGNLLESSALADADTLASSLRLPDFQSVTANVGTPADIERLRRTLAQNPALQVEVTSEQAYWRRLAQVTSLFTTIAYVVGGIMGLGAMFGALNTMYAAVSSRRVEIATLRAIGFGGGAVMFSVLAESLLLAFVGAMIGALFAWAAFSGSLSAIGPMAMILLVSPGMMAGGVMFACGLATVAGFFPALRAARQPIAMALRAT